ncbi:hypothetical protein AgCh_012217 [Apium graveolens]
MVGCEDIDHVVTRAKKLDVILEEQDLTTSGDWCLARIKDPYGIIWMVRSSLQDSSNDNKDAKQGDEIEEADKVTIWEKQQHIYVKAPNGPKAIQFCKSVFLAKEVPINEGASNEQTNMVDEKASTAMVTAELNFGRKRIIVSEVELGHDSSLIDKNAGNNGVGTEDYIFVEVEHTPAAVVAAVALGAYCDIVKTNIGHLVKIMDPFGNTWLVGSCAKPPAPA